jgi:hypothetical protein
MNQRHDQHKLLIFNEQAHQAILKSAEIRATSKARVASSMMRRPATLSARI